jgi:hypothetical protein
MSAITKAANAPAPARRPFLDGAAALLADAELTMTCAEHVLSAATINAAGPDADLEDDRIWQVYDRTRDAISDAEPQTVAGLVAKARAAKAEALQPDGSENPEGTMAEKWAWDIVNDLIRISRPIHRGDNSPVPCPGAVPLRRAVRTDGDGAQSN